MEMKILDRIKKLQALAGDNPSESEAIAAAAKVQDLLLEHNLSMSDVDSHSLGEPQERIGKAEYAIPNANKLTITWKSILYHGIAKINFCETIKLNNSTKIALIGKPSNVQTVVYLADVLVRQIERMARAEGQTVLSNRALYEREYCLGAAQRVLRRLREAKDQATSSGPGMALVVASGKQVDKVFRTFFPNIRHTRSSIGGRTSGYGAGQSAGNGISLPGGGITTGTRGLLR